MWESRRSRARIKVKYSIACKSKHHRPNGRLASMFSRSRIFIFHNWAWKLKLSTPFAVEMRKNMIYRVHDIRMRTLTLYAKKITDAILFKKIKEATIFKHFFFGQRVCNCETKNSITNRDSTFEDLIPCRNMHRCIFHVNNNDREKREGKNETQ